MVGPVLYQEMLLASRHGRWHRFRWIYAGWLLFVLLVMYWFFCMIHGYGARRPLDLTGLANFSRTYLQFFAWQHYLLLTMATPVLVAGAITDEKARGTLQYLLTADLLAWEVVLGKLIGRLYQAMMLVGIGLPLFFFFGVFAGLSAIQVLGFLVCTMTLLFALGAASVLASVWCRHTRDAVLSLYFLGMVISVGLGLPVYLLSGEQATWLERTVEVLNPFLPLGPRWPVLDEGEYLARLGRFTLCWGVLGGVCVVLGVARLRRAYVRQLENSGRVRKKRHWWHLSRPPVGSAPLSWKERYVEGVAPLAVLRVIPTWLGVLLVFVLSVINYGSILLYFLPVGVTPANIGALFLELDFVRLFDVLRRISIPHQVFWAQGMSIMQLTAILIGVRCSGAVTREREKRTWEALLLTPLTTKQLIRGKLWGIAGAAVPYLVAYAIPAVLLSIIAGPAAFLWTLLWLGVMVLALWYAGAAGLWCSVRSSNSWRSLLKTLAFLFVGSVALFFVVVIFACVFAFFIWLFGYILSELLRDAALSAAVNSFLTDFQNSFFISFCLVLALAFFFVSWRLLADAEYRVSVLERTKHWKDEPKRPDLRRRPPPVPRNRSRPREPQWD
jgi:ABC-type transport system involved in multi-copper enzyme maturation permease subunit